MAVDPQSRTTKINEAAKLDFKISSKGAIREIEGEDKIVTES